MPITNETQLKFVFNLQQINIILTALSEAPYKMVSDLINDVRAQVTPQLKQYEDAKVQELRPGVGD